MATPKVYEAPEEDLDRGGEESSTDHLVHVYPTFGREHTPIWDCWCHPEGEWQDGVPVWIHKIHH